VALLVAGLTPAPEAALGQSERLTLRADARERGFIGLRLHSQTGVAVRIEERGARLARLTPTTATTSLRRAARWRCDRRRRRFVARSADGQSAAAVVRTPSCRRRLALSLPARSLDVGRVGLRLVDRWAVGGFAARVCIEPPGGPGHCRRVGVGMGERSGLSSFRALRAGGWRVTARTRWARAASAVRVAPPSGRLRVLAGGDSMIQRLDRFLARRLRPRGVLVKSDAHPATGISKPLTLDWVEQARRAAATRPDVVVMFIGAADGFPMGGAGCCGRAWRAAYTRRAGKMMSAYGRGGRARVVWLLLPTPRGGFARRSFPAVNNALRRAAATRRRDVRILDLGKVFSPGGRYRKWIRVGHREVGVRQADGIHLSDEGAAIAAKLVVRTLRRERILR
jgi:lysophospholipase L1-like esterase